MFFTKPVVNFYTRHVDGPCVLISERIVLVRWNFLKELVEEKRHRLHSFFLVCKNPDGSINDYALIFTPKINRAFCGVKLSILMHRHADLLAFSDLRPGESMPGEMENNLMERFIIGEERHMIQRIAVPFNGNSARYRVV